MIDLFGSPIVSPSGKLLFSKPSKRFDTASHTNSQTKSRNRCVCGRGSIETRASNPTMNQRGEEKPPQPGAAGAFAKTLPAPIRLVAWVSMSIRVLLYLEKALQSQQLLEDYIDPVICCSK